MSTQRDYWAECLSITAEEIGLVFTSEQLDALAEAAEMGHEHYGMAFYSPPSSDRWKSFANFMHDMGQRPTPKHTLASHSTRHAIALYINYSCILVACISYLRNDTTAHQATRQHGRWPMRLLLTTTAPRINRLLLASPRNP